MAEITLDRLPWLVEWILFVVLSFKPSPLTTFAKSVCLQTWWVRSLYSVHKLHHYERKISRRNNLGRAGIRTLGSWMRSANATSVLFCPHIHFNTFLFRQYLNGRTDPEALLQEQIRHEQKSCETRNWQVNRPRDLSPGRKNLSGWNYEARIVCCW